MVCLTILRPSCTTRSQLSPKMANLPFVISLICKARLLMWFSVMETHSRRMPCTSVAVSKYHYYCILCCTFDSGWISVALQVNHVLRNSLKSLLIRAHCNCPRKHKFRIRCANVVLENNQCLKQYQNNFCSLVKIRRDLLHVWIEPEVYISLWELKWNLCT